jgi:hypothetical protein
VRNQISDLASPVGPYRVYTAPLGARQETPRPPGCEGGSLDDYSSSKTSAQKKRRDRLMRSLAPPWRAVLEEIGIDAFLRAVRALQRTVEPSGHRRRVYIPTERTVDHTGP